MNIDSIVNLISSYQQQNITSMHNYNVANRFTTKTKLGNWYQQQEFDSHEFKEYLYQKNNNNNLTLNTTSKISFSNQQLSLTSAKQANGLWTHGQTVQLENAHTHAVLAFNINEAILGEQTYAVTTTQQRQPALRNVYKAEPAKEGEDGVIRFGDKIRIVASFNNRKLYLQSLPISPQRSSKFSRLQEVSVTANLNSGSLWAVEKVDAKSRFDAVGQQVAPGEPVLLKHIGTGQWLASDLVKYVNEFGVEYEVFGKSFLVNNKTQNLFAQSEGHRSAGNPLRSQGIQNEWIIVKG